MAATAAAVSSSDVLKTWAVTSTADGDLTLVITHGFTQGGVAVTPAEVWLGLTQTRAYSKAWVVSAVDTTTITLTAISAAGGGLAGTPQLKVFAMLPHTILGAHL